MKHDRKVVVEILNKYIDTSTEVIGDLMLNKLKGFLPENLQNELQNRLIKTHKDARSDRVDILNDYASEIISFKEMVTEMSKLTLDASLEGQSIAHAFNEEFYDEIAEFQLKNADKISEKLIEFGFIPEINSNGGDA